MLERMYISWQLKTNKKKCDFNIFNLFPLLII